MLCCFGSCGLLHDHHSDGLQCVGGNHHPDGGTDADCQHVGVLLASGYQR